MHILFQPYDLGRALFFCAYIRLYKLYTHTLHIHYKLYTHTNNYTIKQARPFLNLKLLHVPNFAVYTIKNQQYPVFRFTAHTVSMRHLTAYMSRRCCNI